MIKFDNDLKIFYSTKINDSFIFSGFGTRALGDGRKTGEIIDFFQKNKINFQKLVVLGQIHSVNIFFYNNLKDERKIIKIDDYDGIITNQRGVVLTVRTADCLPIIFADKKKGLIGISHQGWRGSLKKMVLRMIDNFLEQGAKKQNIIVAIGPGINQCCYNIDDDRCFQFFEEFDGYSQKVFSIKKGRKYLNLALLNFLLLLDKGIKKENIDFFPFCTACDRKNFFSYRRERKKGLSGEMFSFIIMTSEMRRMTYG